MQAFSSNPTPSLQPPRIGRLLYLSPHGCESGCARRWVPPHAGTALAGRWPRLQGSTEAGGHPWRTAVENGLRW